MRIYFVVITEGSSDDSLIPHLEDICIEAGADEATGIVPDWKRLRQPVGRSVKERIEIVRLLEPNANLFIIHRDADSRDSRPRLREIADAVAACGLTTEWCAMVPVQETEAWLLLDEAAIRRVSGKPNGRTPLGLPRPRNVEAIARPKEFLQQALISAAEVTGRRLRRFREQFLSQRRILLNRLPVGGPLLQVPSWVDTTSAIQQSIANLQSMLQPTDES